MTKVAVTVFVLIGLMGCNSSKDMPSDVSGIITYYQNNGKDLLDSPWTGALLVAADDSIYFKDGIGYANTESENKIDANTRFYIGSLTKQFTANLILQLAQEGLLNLSDSLINYIPEFSGKEHETISIHQLLTHTSGLPHYPVLLNHGYTEDSFFSTPLSTDEYVKLIGSLNLNHPSGEHYSYSSFGYILLGVIIERVTERTFGEVIEQRIATPLELTATGYSEKHLKSNFAEDYTYDAGFLYIGASLKPHKPRELSNAFSTGGMYSSLNDLYLWSKALQDHSLLNEKFQRLMFEPFMNGYTYGLFKNPEEFLRDDIEAQLYYHGGGIMGYRSVFAMYDDGTIIIALFNTLPLSNHVRFINQLSMAVQNRKNRSREFIHPSLRNLTAFNEEGGLQAFSYYHEELSRRAGYSIPPSPGTLYHVISMHLENDQYPVIKEFCDAYLSSHNQISEPILNAMGYAFLEHEEFETAIHFLEENIERHPRSSNSFDSLGEAFEKKGDLLKALKYYKKAIQIGKRNNETALEVYQQNFHRVEEKLNK